MRIACLGDLHIRNTVPVNRTDNFIKTLFGKLRFIYNYCVDNNVQAILLPGDVFNTPIQTYPILIRTLNLFHGVPYANIKICACYGQHDLLFHNKTNRDVALNVMESGKAVTILDKPAIYKDAVIYGCHYGDEIPEITTKGCLNILVIHKMIIAEKKLWDKQEGHVKSSSLLRNHNFDLIVSGDNHNTFQDNYRNRYLVNAGSLMREKIDQESHKPCFFIYDSDEPTNKVEKIYIPIQPFNEVFKEKEEPLPVEFDDQFTEQLLQQEDISINFKKNVLNTMNQLPEKELSDGAKEIVRQIFIS
jgi:DNA repair exonuclease SbcCD nuclease subunit